MVMSPSTISLGAASVFDPSGSPSSAAVREDLPHIRVRICGTLKIIEVLAGG
jgi:hypothetical protein